jgi:hypothetical protein
MAATPAVLLAKTVTNALFLSGKQFEVHVSEVTMHRHTRSLIIATTAFASAMLLATPAWAQRGRGQQDRRDDDRRPRPERGYGAPYGARRPVFVQPYYYFRPRLTLNFGFHVGYGVAYPWRHWDPYGFYNYGFEVRPTYAPRYYYGRVGGVSLDVRPWDASIYIDGRYVGIAADFGPRQMPLTLPAGKHKVELRSEGYRKTKFDVHVVAGQVIPVQGGLRY